MLLENKHTGRVPRRMFMRHFPALTLGACAVVSGGAIGCAEASLGGEKMSSVENSRARAVADTAERYLLASVEIVAPPERVFHALASNEVVDWWVRPGVFDTREWTGDVRVGGRWRGSGVFKDRPYVLEGEFLEVDPPRKLAHTWHPGGAPGASTTVTYLLEPRDRGTRITLRHSGFALSEACINTAIGWETSFERLAEILAPELPPGRG